MAGPLQFTITHQSATTHARVGRVVTPHGSFDTPAFMPVGTRGTIKGLTPAQIEATGSQIILNNAYHLMLRPGDELVARHGGVHGFMRWNGPILTDSGGYQAFSMADINAIDEDGVTFASIIDGSKIRMTPERSIEVQNNLGADIIMAFDDCPPACVGGGGGDVPPSGDGGLCAGDVPPSGDGGLYRRRLVEANERTIRWLERCAAAHQRRDEQALFGIVQGGQDEALRRQSAEQVCGIDLPGYAIGGVAVGEGTAQIRQIVQHTASLLPARKPRYLMGVGYERDIVAAVKAGVDMFDCVLPTRNGRNAQAFTRSGVLRLRNARFADDDAVIEAGCDCEACIGGFTRAYLRHLFMAGEMLGPILVSIHNIRHEQRLLLDIRRAIREDAWSSLERSWPVLNTPAPGSAASLAESAAEAPDGMT
jgi:queuine tRNA-ribosyltransferase